MKLNKICLGRIYQGSHKNSPWRMVIGFIGTGEMRTVYLRLDRKQNIISEHPFITNSQSFAEWASKEIPHLLDEKGCPIHHPLP